MQKIHIPKEVLPKLTNEQVTTLNAEYDAYLAAGGTYPFRAWLVQYHTEIYINVCS